jgi:uncharacterized protein YndB with AHSA1/START domain
VIELEQTRTVDRPTESVFTYLERPDGYAAWLPGVRSIATTDGQPLHRGSPLEVAFDGPAGPIATTGAVIELVPGERVAIEAESRELAFGARFELRPLDDARTELTLHVRLELRGMFRFAERMLAARAPIELGEALDRLKARLESETATTD